MVDDIPPPHCNEDGNTTMKEVWRDTGWKDFSLAISLQIWISKSSKKSINIVITTALHTNSNMATRKNYRPLFCFLFCHNFNSSLLVEPGWLAIISSCSPLFFRFDRVHLIRIKGSDDEGDGWRKREEERRQEKWARLDKDSQSVFFPLLLCLAWVGIASIVTAIAIGKEVGSSTKFSDNRTE